MQEPKPPWIRIASRRLGVEREDALAFLPKSLGFRALYPDEVPVRHKAGPEGFVSPEVMSWVINLGPLIREIFVWSITGYAAKKFTDSVMGEAGKDLYKGIKKFAQFIYKTMRQQADKITDERAYQIYLVSESETGPENVSVRITLPADQALLETILEQLGSFVFPLLGCLATKMEFPEFDVQTARESGWDWMVSGPSGTGAVVVDLEDHEFGRSYPQKPCKEVVGCLHEMGLRERQGK